MKNELAMSTGELPLSSYSNSNKALNDFRSKYPDIKLKFVGYNLKWSETENKYKKKQVEKWSGDKIGTLKDFDKFMTTFDKHDKPRIRDHICIEFDIKDTDTAMIDFDSNHHTLEWIHENYPFLKDHKSFRGNSVGYHFFVQNDANLNIKKETNLDNKKIDYITNSVWIPIYQYEEYINYKPKFISDDQLNLISEVILKSKHKSMIDVLPTDIQQKIYSYNNKEVEELLFIIDKKRADDYADWSKIIASLKSKDLEELVHKFSMRCPEKYIHNDVVDKYKNSNILSIGVVYNYAKIDNPEKFKRIRLKYKFKDLDFQLKDFSSSILLAEKLAPFLKKSLVCINDPKTPWCYCKDGIWLKLKSPHYAVATFIEKGVENTLIKISKEITELDEEEDDKKKQLELKREQIIKSRKEWDKGSNASQLYKILEVLLCDNKFNSTLDATPYQLAFKNGTFKLDTMIFYEGHFEEDLISKTLDYDYIVENIDGDVRVTMKGHILRICNDNQDDMDYIMSYIGFALCAVPHEHQQFRYHIGKGGNGKSELMKWLRSVVPIYINDVNSNTIDSNFKNPHKFIKNFQGARLSLIEELPKAKLNTALLKHLCDGTKNYNNEVMFGENEDINLLAKIIINSNEFPNAAKFDSALQRRFFPVRFSNKFVDNEVEWKKAEREGYETIRWQDKNINNLFVDNPMTGLSIIMEYMYNYVNSHKLVDCPQHFLDEKEDIVELNNTFDTWLYDNIEIDNCYYESKTAIINAYKVETGNVLTDKELRFQMKDSKFKYNRDKKKNNCKGCFIGFHLKQEEDQQEFINDNDELDL